MSADNVKPFLDFGDYCLIEQWRYGGPDEMYIHKVIGRLRSNTWVDVPVVAADCAEKLHDEIVDVIACVCCGVREREVLRYRAVDCKPSQAHAVSAFLRGLNDDAEVREDQLTILKNENDQLRQRILVMETDRHREIIFRNTGKRT